MSWSATKMVKPIACMLGLATLLAACSDMYIDRRDTIALSTGNALAADKAIQTIDPWPPASANRDIAYNGRKMQAAVERYRTGRVIKPKPMITNSSYQDTAAGAGDAPPADPAH